MVRELIVNAALLITGVFVGSYLFQRPLQAGSKRYLHALYGAYYGVVGAVLLAFNGNEDSYRFLCFHVAPIALCALHGSSRATVFGAGAALLAGGLLATESYVPYMVETTVVGLGSAWIAKSVRRRAVAWPSLAALALAGVLAGEAWEARGTGVDWGNFALYAAFFLAALLATDWYLQLDRSRKSLLKEYTYLTQHDLLTGLLNFQTFQARLQTLLSEGVRVCFFLVDCDDVKSLNTEQGYHTVDGTLKNVANLLRSYFPEALLIGRYGSDEFAVVIPMPDNPAATLENALDRQIPEVADIRLAYGYALFPDQESDPVAFVALVQKRMLETKRRLWLEREAHWLHNERLTAVGELAAGMAHEIRNPLTTVKGFLQVSKQNGYNVTDYYDIIMHEIKRMSDLTAEFLQFSKPAALRPSWTTVQECVQTAVQLTESEAIQHGHQLRITADEAPISALLEKDKIVQVLINVIRNGIDAMGEPGGTLTIAVYRRGEFGVVDVTDTGVGIPDEHLARLFQPFFSTKAKGTGLGLSISQKIMSDHGGFISVRSKVGSGTTFTIRLPAAERDPA
ncbi:ATP-binding protein [Paenibacillus sp.]|uniref:ATP-binding protein n=1 Tax=Paenibacillus sp. TaxID=58172 RepID=UPI002D77C9CB|nr:ATP-binding protein [Paenibacillus sp.]